MEGVFAVYVEQTEGKIHPVSLELIGKAKELAGKNFSTCLLFVNRAKSSFCCSRAS